MKEINIKCPHCAKSFDLTAALSAEVHVRSALIQELGLPSAESTVQAEAVVELAEAHRLRELEYEKHLSELRATILELQRKATPTSQQRMGETFEVKIYEQLKTEFKDDDVTRVGKGRNGGDIVHQIRERHGQIAGSILWEIKNTAGWNSKWIAKVREDAMRCGAQIAVIVTTSLPKGTANFGQIDGIWVTNGICHLSLAVALRAQLLACAHLRTQLSDSVRLTELSTYITSPRFQEHVTTIASAVTALQNQVDREKQFFERHWAERQKLADTISQNISVLAGGVDGIVQRVSECIREGSDPEAQKVPAGNNLFVIERV
jgi:hypothetical protein